MTAPVSRPNLPPARHTRGRDQALWYRPVKVRGYMTTRAMASTACRATCVATTRAESRPGARAGRGRSHGESGAVVRRGGTGAGRGRTGARLGSCRPGARGSDGARRGPKSTGALLGDQEVRLETRVYHPDVARGRPDRPRAKYRGSIFSYFSHARLSPFPRQPPRLRGQRGIPTFSTAAVGALYAPPSTSQSLWLTLRPPPRRSLCWRIRFAIRRGAARSS